MIWETNLNDSNIFVTISAHTETDWWAQHPALRQESQVNEEVRKYLILSAVRRDTCTGQNKAGY